MFRIQKRTFIYSLIFLFIFLLSITIKLPYYIYKPGSADELSSIVEVELSYPSSGEFHLVTVSGGRATPLEYLVAKLSRFQEIVPIDEAIPDGFTDEQYRFYQQKMMDQSKVASQVVAYEAANKDVTVTEKGVYVLHTIEGMPAEEKIEIGDRIIKIDNLDVYKPEDVIDYVNTKGKGDEIDLQIERDGASIEVTIPITTFPEDESKVGLGVQLLKDEAINVDPQVEIKSGNIGGPSAGIMFALEIYNQLTEQDLTKGYRIAGTGEIDIEGNVHRVGGIDKKVIAAHKKNADIFFVPREEGAVNSNYEVAKETAKKIKTKMEIVPIDSFQEAVDFLNQLEPKN